MIELYPCPGCERHVRQDETNCPFCERTLGVELGARRKSVGRLARAAIFAGVTLASTACGDDRSDRAPVDAGAEQDVGVATPYGAPPVRERVV